MTGEIPQVTVSEDMPGPVLHEPTGLPEPEQMHLIYRPIVIYFSAGDGGHFNQSFTRKGFAEQPPMAKMLMGIGQVAGIEPPEHYEAYLKRITNKGLHGKSRLSAAKVREVKQAALAEGYATADPEDESRLVLTTDGVRFLHELYPLNYDTEFDFSETDDESYPTENINTAAEVAIEAAVVPPASVRLIPPSEKRLDPESESDQVRIKQLAKLGIRTLDILAELEMAGGTITAEKTLGSTMAGLTRSGISPNDYRKAVETTAQLGLTEYAGQQLDLTPEGETAIADLKSNPELMKEKGEYVWPHGATAKILQSIEDDAIYLDSEGNLWVAPPDSQDPIIRTRAEQLGMREDAYTRRLYEMHAVKQYITVKRLNGAEDAASAAQVVNMRLDPDGVAQLRKVQQRLAEESPDVTEQIGMVEAATEECIWLAGRLGKTDLLEMLKATNRDWSIVNASPAELDERLETMEVVLNKLLYEHDFWLGEEELEPFDEYDYAAHLSD